MALLLSANDVRQALPIKDAIETSREAFRELALGNVNMPLRIHLKTLPDDGDILVMPSHIPQTGMVGVKLVKIFKANPARGLPFIQGLVIVSDDSNGAILAIMDGAALTALRTGAASGLATDLLARKESRVVAVFGAGVQARTQLDAVRSVRDIREVRIHDHVPGAADRFARKLEAETGLSARGVDSGREALDGADIVCAATTSPVPVFRDVDVGPGTHINAIGSFRPEVQEICEGTVVRSKTVVDLKEMALAESGDLIIPIQRGLMTEKDIHGDLGDVLIGRLPGRENDEEITLFKSVGLAMQDLAAAARIIENCRTMNIGTTFSFQD
ncbi:MAG: ornithine cyclodeaminase family protein [Lentisphaeria bacterium]|nr:ornithine cyclodeaminase family protein [Lentisphaeria bacterium]